MKSQDIVSLLEVYKKKIIQAIGSDNVISITSAYSFIFIQTSEYHIQFQIGNGSAKLSELYPDNASLKSKIESGSWPTFDSKIEKSIFSNEIIQQLATADDIASKALNCASGDSYEPGNFSKIILTDETIELQQVNHMNAKSLDHKTNYSLRSLIFKIDLKNGSELEIHFRDSSSPNNKNCGDEIEKAINLAYPSRAKL